MSSRLHHLVLGLVASTSTGCLFFTPYDTAFVEGDDVTVEPPGMVSERSGGERGDVNDLAVENAQDVNGWVSEVVVAVGTPTHLLDQYPENGRDGSWRVYGPYDDQEGRDLSWLIKLDGDTGSARYQVHVGTRGASAGTMALLLGGDITVSGSVRSGQFLIDFDVLDDYKQMVEPRWQDESYGGTIDVTFSRDVDSEKKYVDLDFNDFWLSRPGWLTEELYFTDETYSYQREADGSGRYHLAVQSTFENEGWSGPQVERMDIDVRWDESEIGRARGTIVEAGGEGDLAHGDLAIHECFDAGGTLTYREINEAYAVHLPGYNMGDADSCLFDISDL